MQIKNMLRMGLLLAVITLMPASTLSAHDWRWKQPYRYSRGYVYGGYRGFYGPAYYGPAPVYAWPRPLYRPVIYRPLYPRRAFFPAPVYVAPRPRVGVSFFFGR